MMEKFRAHGLLELGGKILRRKEQLPQIALDDGIIQRAGTAFVQPAQKQQGLGNFQTVGIIALSLQKQGVFFDRVG